MVELLLMYPEVKRYKNKRPVYCPVCGGKLVYRKEYDIWECEGLATPKDDALPLQSCNYVFFEDTKTDSLTEDKKQYV
jgi:hypothetical protein